MSARITADQARKALSVPVCGDPQSLYYAGHLLADFVDQCESELEDRRVERWHATYNAALSGVLSVYAEVVEPLRCSAIAAEIADDRHGTLHKYPLAIEVLP